MRAKPPPSNPYTLCLKWLGARELTEFQIRQRLRSRQVLPEMIDATVDRLRRGGALDDRRTALACARTHALVKRHGRTRIMRELEAIGIDRDLARGAVQNVFEQVDERALMERALAGRTGRRTRSLIDRSEYRRLFAYLVRQGFEPSAVHALLRARSRGAARQDDE